MQPEDNQGKKIFHIKPVGVALFGLVAVFFLYQIIGGGLSALIFGFDPSDDNLTATRLMTMASQMLFILLPALILTRFFFGDISQIIKLRIPALKEILLFTGGLFLLTVVLQSYMYVQDYLLSMAAASSGWISGIKTQLDQFDRFVESSYNILLKPYSVFDYLLVTLIATFVPAVCEEVFFRGFIQGSLQVKYKGLTAGVFTALFFSLYHMHPYQFIPLGALGLFFGYASYKSRTLILPIILHFLNNLMAIVLFFITGADDMIEIEVADVSTFIPSILVFTVSLILFAMVVIYINLNYAKVKKEDHFTTQL